MLGDFSRLLNRVLGGTPGKSLCWRWAMKFGPYSRFCRAVDWVLGPDHCRSEMSVEDFIEWKRRQVRPND